MYQRLTTTDFLVSSELLFFSNSKVHSLNILEFNFSFCLSFYFNTKSWMNVTLLHTTTDFNLSYYMSQHIFTAPYVKLF